ncbi:MAG: LacI family DNA-binding transcriptional regulator [Novosphingobium sp.]
MAKITISDVAMHAGVSKKTVSFVINGLEGISNATRQKVEASISALGYVPNPQGRALATGRAAMIAIIHDGSDPAMLASTLDGVATAIDDRPIAMAVKGLAGRSATDTDSLSTFLENQRPQAVLLLPPLSSDNELAGLCIAASSTCVRIAPTRKGYPAGLVCSNDRQAVLDAVGYLRALGHRRIAFIAGPDGHPAAAEREAGFSEAMDMQAGGLDTGVLAQGDFTFLSGLEVGRLLLELSPRPTAILAANADMAAGVLMAAQEQALVVPAALSVMAIGDITHGDQFSPPLTTMALPFEEMARLATLKALRPTEAGTLPVDVFAELVKRGSAGAAPSTHQADEGDPSARASARVQTG